MVRGRHRPARPSPVRATILQMTELVLFDVDSRGVATITLNRPDSLNAINMAMRDLLWDYLRACRDMPEVEVLMFKGAGRAFSAGADISEFGTAPSIMDSRWSRHGRPVWELLLTLPVTTMAAMHGYCYGAGLELPLCCDLRLAAAGTQFAVPEVSLGYIPSAGGTQTLGRTIPPGVAAHMILSGEPIDAAAALRWGLVESVADDLESAMDRRVSEVLALPRDERPRRRPVLRDFAALQG